MGVPSIGLVYLVRAANGIKPLVRFLASYGKNPGGIPHELIILLKGFTDRRGQPRRGLLREYDQALALLHHRQLFVSDVGFDIGAYFQAVVALDYDHLCFLNSFSVLRDEQWLGKMHQYCMRSGIGLIGATGSYQSIYSDSLSPPSAKAEALGLPLQGRTNGGSSWLARSARSLKRRVLRGYFRRSFPPFPNYHVRTNGFLVSRRVLLAIDPPLIRWKMDGYRFESGTRSLTRQILAMGLRPVLVGRDGRAYEKEEWPGSNTFWQEDQANLLVADNQTEAYARGDAATRWRYARYAWGNQARPR
jgi:hypothetical protein